MSKINKSLGKKLQEDYDENYARYDELDQKLADMLEHIITLSSTEQEPVYVRLIILFILWFKFFSINSVIYK